MNTEQLRNRVRAQSHLPDHKKAKALRVAAGLSLREMADAVGTTQRTICFWEAGERKPSKSRLERYVEVLRVLAAELPPAS